MKFVFACCLLLLARPAAAQATWNAPVYNWGSGWCSSCYVYAAIDAPNASAPFDGSLSGWAFEGTSGQSIDRIDVYYGTTRADSYIATLNGERPDVEQYFLPYCPSITSNSGWTVGFRTPIPSGTWLITVVLWKGMISTTISGTVVVP